MPNIMGKYKILKPEALGFLPSDLENPDFAFSFDGKSEDEMKSLVDDGVVSLIDNTSEP